MMISVSIPIIRQGGYELKCRILKTKKVGWKILSREMKNQKSEKVIKISLNTKGPEEKEEPSKKLKLKDKIKLVGKEDEEVKFLYESKSGKSNRRSMVLVEQDTISSTYTKPYLDLENR